MNDDKTPLVSIICLTYNHAPYIRECLDGFLMQKTDFPIEVIIHDDASTDGTTNIIKEYASKYPDIIKPIIQTENQYSKHNDFNKIMQNCIEQAIGKYIALCEGDDYWIDQLKIQKQVDFLDLHPDYILTYTKCIRLKKKSNPIIDIWGGPYTLFKDLVILNTIPTLTTLFRTEMYKNYYKEINPTNQYWMMGDYPMWLYFSLKGKIYFFNENTSVYRILDNSASHSQNKIKNLMFKESCNEISIFFLKRQLDYNFDKILNNKLALRIQFKYQMSIMSQDRQNITKLKLLQIAIKKPMSIKQRIKLLILTVLPNSLINKLHL